MALLDVNALVALAWDSHVHHVAIRSWFAARAADGWATCPITESGFVRVSSNPKVLPNAIATSNQIKATMERLKDDINPLDFGSEWLNDIAWHSQFLSADDHERMDFERLLGERDHQPKYHISRTNPAPSWRMGAAASRYLMEDGQNASGRFVYDFTTGKGG